MASCIHTSAEIEARCWICHPDTVAPPKPRTPASPTTAAGPNLGSSLKPGWKMVEPPEPRAVKTLLETIPKTTLLQLNEQQLDEVREIGSLCRLLGLPGNTVQVGHEGGDGTNRWRWYYIGGAARRSYREEAIRFDEVKRRLLELASIRDAIERRAR